MMFIELWKMCIEMLLYFNYEQFLLWIGTLASCLNLYSGSDMSKEILTFSINLLKLVSEIKINKFTLDFQSLNSFPLETNIKNV
jgi:hypothetical protein